MLSGAGGDLGQSPWGGLLPSQALLPSMQPSFPLPDSQLVLSIPYTHPPTSPFLPCVVHNPLIIRILLNNLFLNVLTKSGSF